MFEFAFVFMFVFVFTAMVGIGVGEAMLVFRFMFALLTLLFAASPQAIPNEPSANTAVSAIFFIILDDLLSSSKSKNIY
jgi:hypothetical protein